MPKNEIFGDPCPGRDKWLSISMRCSDRYMAKDYVTANGVSALLTSGAYSVGTWVKPGMKKGVQTVLSFGVPAGKDANNYNNRALLQWEGRGPTVSGVSPMKSATSGVFFYYDDHIMDAATTRATTGKDLEVAVGSWYYVMVTITESGEGTLYLNGQALSTFTTKSRPDTSGVGTFHIGMDLDDMNMPREFIAGDIDEVVVYNRALSASDVMNNMFWAEPSKESLVAYYRFNAMAGTAAKDEMGANHASLSASATTKWSDATQSFDGAVEVHPTYSYTGAPWFPAVSTKTTYKAGSFGPVKGGETITVQGVNFDTDAHVKVDGVDVDAVVVSDLMMTATVPAKAGAGGSSEVEVTNSKAGQALTKVPFSQKILVEDLQSGIVCYYPLNGDVKDYSGMGRHGMTSGATIATGYAGMPSTAYMMGPEDTIKIPSCTGGVTVAMWVYYNSPLFPAFSPQRSVWEATIGYPSCSATADAITYDSWEFVVGTLTTTYVNGKLASSTTRYADLVTSVLGNKLIGENFDGIVDSVAVYNRKLSPEEVMALYETNEYAIRVGPGAAQMSFSASEPEGVEGLKVTYYGAGKFMESIMAPIQHDWMAGSPLAALGTDGWSAHFKGHVYAPVSAEYYFYLEADDGVKLVVDGHTLIDGAAHAGDVRRTHGNVELVAGWYPIEIMYTDKTEGASIKLEWVTTDGSIKMQTVPSKNLRAGTGALALGAWVKADSVDGYQAVLSQHLDAAGTAGIALGIFNGGVTAAVHVGCKYPASECNPYRQINSIYAKVTAGSCF